MNKQVKIKLICHKIIYYLKEIESMYKIYIKLYINKYDNLWYDYIRFIYDNLRFIYYNLRFIIDNLKFKIYYNL